MPYLTLIEYRSRSAFEGVETDEFFARPDRVSTFDDWEEEARSEIDDTLRRRYAVPFGAVPSTAEPDPTLVPKAVKRWMRALIAEMVQEARRIPGQEVDGDSDIVKRADRARKAMENAVNDEVPHPELPLRADLPGSSGETKGAPIVHEIGFTVHDAWRNIGGRPP